MTRKQTRTYGVVTPSTRQPLLEAMLCAFAWLVSNVVSICRTIFKRHIRDWHADRAEEVQCPTPNDITQEAQTSQPSFSGKAAGSIPRIPVVSSQGTTTNSLCAKSQDARHKAEHDSDGVAPTRASQALILSSTQSARPSKEFNVTCAAGDLVRGTKSSIDAGSQAPTPIRSSRRKSGTRNGRATRTT